MAEYDLLVRQSLTTAKYREIEKTRRDVMDTLSMYRGLKPQTEVFVFNHGGQKLLLNLSGTIPVRYEGQCYHIPVRLWLLDTHPLNAPMVFVTPTSDMRIKVSRHVDHTGKVYLPYLHDWNHSSSDLLTLIQVMIMTFGDHPPVYSVSTRPPPSVVAQPNVPYPTTTPYPTPYPPMPMPIPGISPGGYGTANQVPAFSVRPSLITAVEEKLRRRLEDAFLSCEIVKKTGEQLKAGEARLQSLVQQIENEKTTLNQHLEILEAEVSQLDSKISKQKTEENDAMIDDAISAPTPLYKQIVNAYSEEVALEDTIYYLGKAFMRERLELEQYLKNVRALSRKQFMHRALLQKCRAKAGLAG